MLHRLLILLIFPVFVLLGACQGYDFKVNEKIVYTTKPLLGDFSASDPALTACLEQAIVDDSITTAEQLTSLNCAHAGIESLEGLAVFTGLTALRLSSNKIRNLVEITNIVTLEEVHLDDNQIVDPVPLYQLTALRLVDLSGNPELQCPRGGAFDRVETVILPEHCR